MALGRDDRRGLNRARRDGLAAELARARSPVRRFFGSRFTTGLRDVQRRYRKAAPALVIPVADRQWVNPGTLETAADWLLRFLLCPAPSLQVATAGAYRCGPRSGVVQALTEIAGVLGLGRRTLTGGESGGFGGPVAGNDAEPEFLASVCWILALLTEVLRAGSITDLLRGGQRTAPAGPLGQFWDRQASAGELLNLVPMAVQDQLGAFRHVFEETLLPQLATRHGHWYLQPEANDSWPHSTADLIAAGLLIDLETSARKPTLGRDELFHLIGCALFDRDDAYQLTDLGIFSARYAYLATWDLQSLLDELAGRAVSLADTRKELRQLLVTR
jgi:hypothetical protein